MNQSMTHLESPPVVCDPAQAESSLLSAATINGDDVCNLKDENLGRIKDLMIDPEKGEIRYAVMVSGGLLGMGDRLFAIPWKALKHDRTNDCFTLDVDVQRLKNAPGFDKNLWPDMADATWNMTVESYYVR